MRHCCHLRAPPTPVTAATNTPSPTHPTPRPAERLPTRSRPPHPSGKPGRRLKVQGGKQAGPGHTSKGSEELGQGARARPGGQGRAKEAETAARPRGQGTRPERQPGQGARASGRDTKGEGQGAQAKGPETQAREREGGRGEGGRGERRGCRHGRGARPRGRGLPPAHAPHVEQQCLCNSTHDSTAQYDIVFIDFSFINWYQNGRLSG